MHTDVRPLLTINRISLYHDQLNYFPKRNVFSSLKSDFKYQMSKGHLNAKMKGPHTLPTPEMSEDKIDLLCDIVQVSGFDIEKKQNEIYVIKCHAFKATLPTAEATQQNDSQGPSSGGKISEFS